MEELQEKKWLNTITMITGDEQLNWERLGNRSDIDFIILVL